MSERFYGPIILILGTAIFSWLLVSGFKRGEIEWPYYGLTLSGRREDQPVRFWIVTGCLGLFTVMMVVGTVGAIFFPHGI
jgi:hypothetical protein